MPVYFSEAAGWFGSHGNLVIPLVLAMWIAWGDLKTRRIPNYLTLITALAGLTFSFMSHGLHGLADGFAGMGLGICLLTSLIFGVAWGPGIVRLWPPSGPGWGFGAPCPCFVTWRWPAGSWPWRRSGGRGQLWTRLRQGWMILLNWILCRSYGQASAPVIKPKTPGIPYGVAIALGMAVMPGEEYNP